MAKNTIGFKQTASAPQVVVNQLVIKAPRREILTVGKVSAALRSADMGKRTALYDIYEECLRDNVLSESIGKRVRAITNANLTFQVDGQPVPEIEELMQTGAFEELLKEAFLTKFWGKTVLELSFTNGFGVYNIPRKHLRTKTKTIALDQNNEGSISYLDNDFFIEVGKDNDLGLLLNLIPLVIYKRGGFGDYAQYVELFGMPQRIGKYEAYDNESRKALEEAMEKMGSAPYLVVPKSTDIETAKTEGKSGGTVYAEFRQACNEEMLIGVLGQTMTTLNGSSRSQSETHMEVEADMHADDQKFIARLLNEQLTWRLEKRGFPVTNGKWLFPEKGENISLKDRITIDEKVNNKVPIPKAYWYKTYGIPEPKPSEETTGGTPQSDPTPPTPPTDKKKLDTKQTTLSDDLNLFERLVSFFVSAPAQKVTGAKTFSGVIRTNNIALSDVPAFDYTALLVRVAAAQKAGRPLRYDAELANFTAGQLVKAFRAGWHVNKNIKLIDPELSYHLQNDMVQTAMEQNIFYFSAAKDAAQLSELNRLFRESKGFSDFFNRAQKLNDTFNKTYLQTEYDTAYLTAESSATYYRLKSQIQTFPFWQYMTVNDGHVRAEHAALHGIILPANDKRWSKIYPPNGWNCRCYIIPLTRAEATAEQLANSRVLADDFLTSGEFKTATKSGFGVNRAELKQVFTANQQYVDKATGKKLFNFNYADFGLAEMSKIMSSTNNTLPLFKGDAGGWYSALSKIDANPVLTDYAGRNLVFEKKAFNDHISKAGRTEILTGVPDTVQYPDEVWLNSHKNKEIADNYLFVKYYHNKTVVVSARIAADKYTVETWFELAPNAERLVRRGIRVK